MAPVREWPPLEVPVLEVENLRAGEYLYVRAIQNDQGTAWSSPIFFE